MYSPDSVLQDDDNNRLHAIYECKNYSDSLPLGVHREFLGYLSEMPIQKHNQGYSPELQPSIYMSANAGTSKVQMMRKYDFRLLIIYRLSQSYVISNAHISDYIKVVNGRPSAFA